MAEIDRKATREWYSVPVSSVQRLVTLVGLIVLSIAGLVLYQRVGVGSVETRAENTLDECGERINTADQREDRDQHKDKIRTAKEIYSKADEALTQNDFQLALETGEQCLITLAVIERQDEGLIRVLSAQGSVEYRRGERGSWNRLRDHDTLNPGDWVKTQGDGTAELLFADGSLFTLRQSTMIHMGGSPNSGENEATNIEYGGVELNTSATERTVATPRSSARVRRDSEALVAFDRNRGAGRFAAFTGGLEVTSKDTGEKKEIGALQQIDQLGERLAEIRNLPGKPELSGPVDDHALDLNREGDVVLAWKPVKSARRYSLRVSNSRLFSANLIEDDRRAKTSAKVGVRRDGQFYWQVAAVDARGNLGPWSETRSFRAASLRTIEEVSDKDPPELDILSSQPYGNIVIISGKTEAGATVTIDGESVQLKADGSFRSTRQVTKADWNEFKIVSTDAWNNSSTEVVRIFIDAL